MSERDAQKGYFLTHLNINFIVCTITYLKGHLRYILIDNYKKVK